MEFTIRKGTLKDLEQFIELLQEVRQGMEHKEWLYLDPPEEVRRMMAEGMLELWVAMDGETLAAAFDILIPGIYSFNYGYVLDFSEEALLRVINMDTIAVRPAYRGRKLQQKLIREAEREIALQGSRILLCTVHPENQYSLNNFLSLGYTVEKQLHMYGSQRLILRKNLP